jgi:hypothetical protein
MLLVARGGQRVLGGVRALPLIIVRALASAATFTALALMAALVESYRWMRSGTSLEYSVLIIS